MKAKELAKTLNLVAEILQYFGDMPLQKAVEQIHCVITTSEKKKTIINNAKKDFVVDDELLSQLKSMNSEKLSLFFAENASLKNKSILIKIASILGISLSSRQNVDQMIHTIIKYFERENMDDSIRTNRK